MTVAGPEQLSPRDQAALVAQLQVGLREDGDHDAARNDIVTLLTKLRDREDVTYRTRTDVDAILASVNAGSSRQQPPIVTDTAAQGQAGSTTTMSMSRTHTDDAPSEKVGSPSVPEPRPADRPSAQIGTPTPRPWWQRQRPQVKFGLIAATVVILAATGYLVWPHSPASQTRTAQSSTTSQPSTTSQLVTEGALPALERLWLSPDQINTTVGATGMTVAGTSAGMVDSSANVADKNCLTMQGPAEASIYAGSGWSAARGEAFKEPGDHWIHGVTQYVVAFSSAHDAGAFFTASAQRWAACANRQYTVTLPGQPDHVVIVGPVSNTNGTLSATQTFKADNGIGTCQRALTVANSVAIDVATCFNNEAAQPDSAVNIAHQIAAKVPH
jgi:serine/threonine-protein kinase